MFLDQSIDGFVNCADGSNIPKTRIGFSLFNELRFITAVINVLFNYGTEITCSSVGIVVSVVFSINQKSYTSMSAWYSLDDRDFSCIRFVSEMSELKTHAMIKL